MVYILKVHSNNWTEQWQKKMRWLIVWFEMVLLCFFSKQIMVYGLFLYKNKSNTNVIMMGKTLQSDNVQYKLSFPHRKLCAFHFAIGGYGISFELDSLLVFLSSVRCPVFGYSPGYSCPRGQTATSQNSWPIQFEHCCTHATFATHGEWCSTQPSHFMVL